MSVFWGTAVLVCDSAIAAGSLAAWPVVRRSGYRKGWADGFARQAEELIERNRAPRHARTEPRQQAGQERGDDHRNDAPDRRRPGRPVNGPRTPLVQQQPASPGAAAAPRPQRTPWVSWPPAPPVRPPSGAVTAADLSPVFWAQPGTSIPGHPQAGRDSGAGTIVGGKPVIDTDTGEFRAIAEAHTTQWIEDMQRSEAAFRGEMLA